MKLSDYVAWFLADRGVRNAFVLTGGASLHLIDSIGRRNDIKYVCLAHEQANAMAADGYARLTGKIGVSIATSGPGATNLLTGVCCSYYDSVPTLFITGQVASFRSGDSLGVRQYGFQETNTVQIFSSVTKYSVLLKSPLRIRYELEKAFYFAFEGRPGPVLIDIPDDFQRAEVDPNALESFEVPETAVQTTLVAKVDACLDLIYSARRPVFIAGWGIHLSGATDSMRMLLESLQMPVAPTWAMNDAIGGDNALKIGTFGTHGTRWGNFAIQNADLIVSVGSRLDTHGTGGAATFAREAKKIIVDIDHAELNKFATIGMKTDVLVQADALEFIDCLRSRLEVRKLPQYKDWISYINGLKTKYAYCQTPENCGETDPYRLMGILSDSLSGGEKIFIDTGCAIAWTMQAFKTKPDQSLLHDFNNTAMGWALPASIGGAIASPSAKVYCISGDGSLMMNLQELASVRHYNLDIKVMVLNNHGHSMIQQTQDQWLESQYHGSTPDGGLAFPDFIEVAKGFGFPTIKIENASELRSKLREFINHSGSVFCEVELSPKVRVSPQTKYGRPIEDSEPLLERHDFMDAMLVEAMSVSATL